MSCSRSSRKPQLTLLQRPMVPGVPMGPTTNREGRSMSLPFAILKPVTAPWKPEVDPNDIVVGATVDHVHELIACLREAVAWSLDVETHGKESWLPTTCIVGVGFAWLDTDGDIRACYFDRASMEPDAWKVLLVRINALSHTGHLVNGKPQQVVNHNIMFDAAMWAVELQRATGTYNPRALNYTHCTYGLYKQLAGEGWFGQRWGLKEAQIDLLLWDARGDDELESWLLAHGYHKRGPGRVGSKSHGTLPPAEHLAEVRAWVAAPTKSGKKRSPGALRAAMWRAPPEILGKYCALDAISTLQLYTEVLRPALDRFPELEAFHRGPWVDLLYLLVEQQHHGIRVDREKLETHAECLRLAVANLDVQLRALPVPGRRVSQIEHGRWAAEVAAHEAKRPNQWKSRKLKPPKSARITKRGEVSKSWLRYEEKLSQPLQETKAWVKWYATMEELKSSLREKRFSFTSAADLRELLFGTIGAEGGLIRWEPGERPDPKRKRRGSSILFGKNGRVEVELTKGGALAVGADAMSQLPDAWGEPLRELRDSFKELSYVESYLQVLAQDSAGNWRLHAGWKAPGPVTCRLAGAEPNLQQIPKSLGLLECFIPDDGTAWLEADWTAIEPHVLAELSRDDGLMQLYGPDALPHDRYLFSVAHYPGAVGDAVRQFYPLGPCDDFAERVKLAKKQCKRERAIGKKMVLSGDYGAGWRKQFRGLMAEGVSVTESEVQEMNEAHRQFHRGVYLEFGPELEDEWNRRGGYVLNGLGFPICIAEEKKKDCINRTIQSTSHYIHVMYVSHLARELQKSRIPVVGIIWDFHDEAIIQIPQSAVSQVLRLFSESATWVNEHLGTTVSLKADPRQVENLADAKMESEWGARNSPK